MARPTGRPIRDELVAAATELIQRVGVTGFSYGQLAKELDIKAPSIHHHFKTKEDLVVAVAQKYRSDFADGLATITNNTAIARITAYGELFTRAAQTDKLCLCGAVSAGWVAVGDAARHEVNAFFSEQRSWLEHQLGVAAANGEIQSALPLGTLATAILAALEGSLLISRADGDTDLPLDVATLLTSLIQTRTAHT